MIQPFFFIMEGMGAMISERVSLAAIKHCLTKLSGERLITKECTINDCWFNSALCAVAKTGAWLGGRVVTLQGEGGGKETSMGGFKVYDTSLNLQIKEVNYKDVNTTDNEYEYWWVLLPWSYACMLKHHRWPSGFRKAVLDVGYRVDDKTVHTWQEGSAYQGLQILTGYGYSVVGGYPKDDLCGFLFLSGNDLYGLIELCRGLASEV
jgi:hypothetical protein